MEKTAQNSSGTPRRRRRRRGSGTGASQNPQSGAPRETGKGGQPAAKEKQPRQQPPRKESGGTGNSSHGRHRGAALAETPAQPASGRHGRGSSGGQQTPAREQNHGQKASSRAARAQRKAVDEDPGLELIARRPPKQKFANFEEYLAAHGGMTVPLPEEEPAPAVPSDEAGE